MVTKKEAPVANEEIDVHWQFFDQAFKTKVDTEIATNGIVEEFVNFYRNRVMRQYFAEANKPIAAICHAAQILAAAGVLEGKKCSAYPAVGPDVTRAGGAYVNLAMSEAITDGNLVTAPAWPAHPAWLAQFLAVLGTRITL